MQWGYRCWTEENTEKGCLAFDDVMNSIYHKVAVVDGYIFASPTYYGSVTGLMKVFIDRLLPFYDWAESKNKF